MSGAARSTSPTPGLASLTDLSESGVAEAVAAHNCNQRSWRGETQEAVQTSTSRAQDWIVQRAAHLVEGAPDMPVGEVRVHAEP